MTCSFTTAGSGESDLVSERSAILFTVVVALAELFAGSRVVGVRGHVGLVGDAAGGLRPHLDLDARVAAFASVPSAQVTVPLDSEQVPCVGVADSKVTPAGRASVTLVPVALEGPALSTDRV